MPNPQKLESPRSAIKAWITDEEIDPFVNVLKKSDSIDGKQIDFEENFMVVLKNLISLYISFLILTQLYTCYSIKRSGK